MKATLLHSSLFDFNKERALKVGKAKFKAKHKHLEGKVDLDAEWEKLQPKKEVKGTSEVGKGSFEKLPPADNTEKVAEVKSNK